MESTMTEIVCIVDRSGSMEALREEAIEGFNRFLEAQRAEAGDARLTLVLFNDTMGVVHESADLELVPDLTEATYVPDGSTALLDAVGKTVDDLGRRLEATPDDQRPDSVIVVILTDGEENSSQTFTWPEVSERIAHQRNVYKWDFVFLGADQDAIATASRMSVPAQHAYGWTSDREGLRGATALMCTSVSDLRSPEIREKLKEWEKEEEE